MSEVAAHRFREDLFYRLNVIALRVPPLRERPQDILRLAARLLIVAAARNHRQALRFSPEVESALMAYRWPGNVRELRNAIERATVLVQGDLITPEYLPDALFQEAPAATVAGPYAASLEEVEREQIVRVLAESPTLEDAAETLGINVSTLWRKRRRYKIE